VYSLVLLQDFPQKKTLFITVLVVLMASPGELRSSFIAVNASDDKRLDYCEVYVLLLKQ
jgi:hypothetical protein